MTLKFSPLRAYGILLALIFTVEILLMAALDHLLPPDLPAWLAAALDATLLTAIAGIFIWRLFVHPLNESLLGEAARSPRPRPRASSPSTPAARSNPSTPPPNACSVMPGPRSSAKT